MQANPSFGKSRSGLISFVLFISVYKSNHLSKCKPDTSRYKVYNCSPKLTIFTGRHYTADTLHKKPDKLLVMNQCIVISLICVSFVGKPCKIPLIFAFLRTKVLPRIAQQILGSVVTYARINCKHCIPCIAVNTKTESSKLFGLSTHRCLRFTSTTSLSASDPQKL